MKVTYNKFTFKIDGLPIINPEVLNGIIPKEQTGFIMTSVVDYSFSLPDNIIAEKEDVGQCKALYDDSEHCTCKDNCAEFVYRLKLKEPLVDTGSKETQNELFCELREKVYKSQWLAGDLFNYLRANYTITRK